MVGRQTLHASRSLYSVEREVFATVTSGVAGFPSLLGSGVVAAQLQAGEDFERGSARDQLRVRSGGGIWLAFQNRGEYELKGVPDCWRHYRLVT